jgi:hypothetical protein
MDTGLYSLVWERRLATGPLETPTEAGAQTGCHSDERELKGTFGFHRTDCQGPQGDCQGGRFSAWTFTWARNQQALSVKS